MKSTLVSRVCRALISQLKDQINGIDHFNTFQKGAGVFSDVGRSGGSDHLVRGPFRFMCVTITCGCIYSYTLVLYLAYYGRTMEQRGTVACSQFRFEPVQRSGVSVSVVPNADLELLLACFSALTLLVQLTG